MSTTAKRAFVTLLLMITGYALAQAPSSRQNDKPQQITPIRVSELGSYINQYVVVEGISGQKRDDPARNTKVYLLVDDWNDSIWVRTKRDFPVIGIHYRVQGIVIRDGTSLALIEDSRVDLSGSNSSTTPTSKANANAEGSEKSPKLSQTALIGIGFIVVAIVIAVVLFVVMNKQKARERMIVQQRHAEEMERERMRLEMERSSQPAIPPTGAPAPATVVGRETPSSPQKRQHSHTVEAWGQIRVTTGPHTGMIVPLTGRQLSIGRTEGDLQLPNDTMVSSRHGEIVVTNDGRLLYVDNSRNGSQVDNKPVHRTQIEIATSSAIEIGESRIEIVAARLPMLGASQSAPVAAPSSALTMVGEAPLPNRSSAQTGMFMGVELNVVAGPDSGKRIPIGKSMVTVGRREDQDIVIADGFVSREHLKISQHGAEWMLKNRSEKGTIVNGEHVDEVTLRHGDRIAVGSTVLEFVTLQGMMNETSTPDLSTPDE
ncbi:MAG TPA: FHA domain-containing protein [Armatimonadota bacterium]|nr:FHA domain-containing protein [Armatimonadota bacterium]